MSLGTVDCGLVEGLGGVEGRGLLKSTTTMDGMEETYFKPDSTFIKG